MTSAIDILPTVAKLAGIVPAPEMKVEGVDIWPLLVGHGKEQTRTLYWDTPHQSALREGDWKLVETHPSKKVELFSLRADPYEKVNLAAKQPDRIRQMRKLLAGLKGGDPKPGRGAR
ncbi:MAG: hypothetical protein L0338_30690 [Acidobacteria bacterium]|nr:hypothetical protein [Acidobacteriota bacterium]